MQRAAPVDLTHLPSPLLPAQSMVNISQGDAHLVDEKMLCPRPWDRDFE